MPRLEVLELYRTQVTDAGLAHIRVLKRLTTLSLIRTKVTEMAVERLKRDLPTIVELRHSKQN